MHQHTLQIWGHGDVTRPKKKVIPKISLFWQSFCWSSKWIEAPMGFTGLKSYQYVFPWKSWSNITYSQFPKVCWPWSLLLPLAFSTFFSLQASLFHIDAVLEHPEVGFQKKLQSMTVQLCMLPIDNAFTLIYNFQDYVLLKNFVDYKKPWFPSKATGCHAAQGASRWSGGERKTFVLPRMDGN